MGDRVGMVMMKMRMIYLMKNMIVRVFCLVMIDGGESLFVLMMG